MFIQEFQKYLESEKRFSAHTVVAYSTDLESFLDYVLRAFGHSDLRKINHKTIRGWLVELLDVQKLSNNSVNRKLSTLKTYYRFLLLTKRVDINPTLKVVSPKLSKRLPEFVDQQSMNKLLLQDFFTADFDGVRDQLILEMFYQTGIRLSELIGIQLNDVDYQNNLVRVTGKRNKQRIIPLNEELQELIKKYIQFRNEIPSVVDSLFITKKGKSVYPKLVYNVVNKYLSLISSNNKKSPHILRHTFATHMLNNGADLNSIKELLGHANLSATQVYTHNSFEKLKSIYNQAHPRA